VPFQSLRFELPASVPPLLPFVVPPLVLPLLLVPLPPLEPPLPLPPLEPLPLPLDPPLLVPPLVLPLLLPLVLPLELVLPLLLPLVLPDDDEVDAVQGPPFAMICCWIQLFAESFSRSTRARTWVLFAPAEPAPELTATMRCGVVPGTSSGPPESPCSMMSCDS
jgi:hypothetical protein